MKKKKRLIIVVDMLNGFCKEGLVASPKFMDTIVPNIQKLLAKERQKKSKIVFLCDCHDKDDEEFKLFPPHCLRGTKEAQIIDELAYNPGSPNEFIFEKNRYSPFFSTRANFDYFLTDSLRIYEIHTKQYEVIITGVCTDICVHYTAEEFRNRDFEVIIPANCVDTYNSPDHPADKINEFFLKYHFPNILGIKII